MSWELWLLGLLLLAGGFWWDGLQKREIAVRTARNACARAGVQFLDDSVVLLKLRLARDDNQRSRFYRQFGFEFSTTGDNRHPGRIYLLGARLLDVNLILPSEQECTAVEPEPATTAEVIDFPRSCGACKGTPD